MHDPLRVVDFGVVSPLRSQTLWHALAHGVGEGRDMALSFVRTQSPYVSIGFHTPVEAVNLELCARRNWPVIRRMLGGGVVFMDSQQLCFQLSVPKDRLPAGRSAAMAALLGPVVAAYRAAGLDARLDERQEVVVGDRKVCGHAAAEIGSAVVVVGNLIEGFDHEAAACVLAAPDPAESAEALRLMRRYVASDTAALDAEAFKSTAISSYAQALGAYPLPGDLDPYESKVAEDLEVRFSDPAWTNKVRANATGVWKAKIRSGVWRYCATGKDFVLGLSVVGGRISAARVEGTPFPAQVEARLCGLPLERSTEALASAGLDNSEDLVSSLAALVAAGRHDFS